MDEAKVRKGIRMMGTGAASKGLVLDLQAEYTKVY